QTAGVDLRGGDAGMCQRVHPRVWFAAPVPFQEHYGPPTARRQLEADDMKSILMIVRVATACMLMLVASGGWAANTWRGADAWGSYRADGSVYAGGHGVSSVLWSPSSQRYEITLSAGHYSVDDVT